MAEAIDRRTLKFDMPTCIGGLFHGIALSIHAR